MDTGVAPETHPPPPPADGRREPGADPAPRNLLLITTDQERRYPTDPVPLPGHDRLRRNGTTFDRFYAASMACSPARSVMYTGHHAPVTGVIDNVGIIGQPSMTTEIATLGTRLGALGYRCGYKGKWHLSTEATEAHATGPLESALEEYGFSDYNEAGDDFGLPYEGYQRDRAIADDAVAWMSGEGVAANASGRPWCLAVNLVNPHDIMFATTDGELLERNRSRSARHRVFTGAPDDEIYRATWDLPDEPTWFAALDASSRPAAHVDFSMTNQLFTGRPATGVAELRRFRDYYLNCLRDVDAAIVRILDGLERTGAADRTVVVFTSDHGELAGAHGLFGKGPCSYDENLRVPLIVVDPSRPGGRRTDAIGSQLDLVPTLLALGPGVDASSTPGGPLGGVDLTGALDDGPAIRAAALFTYDGLIFLDGPWALRTYAGMRTDDQVTGRDLSKRGLMRAIVTDRFKFSRYFAPGDHHRPQTLEELLARNTLELFDLDQDPYEQHDLARTLDADALALVESLDAQLSSLVEAEMGADDGRWLPRFDGAPWMTRS